MELLRIKTLVHVDKWYSWLSAMLKAKLVRYVDGVRENYTELLYTRPEGDPGGYFAAGFLDDVIRVAKSKGIEVTYVDLREFPEHAYDTDPEALDVQLRYKQDSVINAIMTNDKGIVKCPTGFGKCLGRGTPVLMYDGSIRAVEDIKVGDQLMGPDSEPRTVLSLSHGEGPLYRFKPNKGDSFVFNENHVLTLCCGATRGTRYNGKHVAQNELVDIPYSEYQVQSASFKHVMKGVRSSLITFEERPAPELDPYFVGVWLGDGGCGTSVMFNPDPEIVDYCVSYGQQQGWSVLRKSHTGCEEIHFSARVDGKYVGEGARNVIKRNTMLGSSKRILDDYRLGSVEVRRQVLAGLLDTDGYAFPGGYEISTKFPELANDILFVARSLGLAAYAKKERKCCTNTGAWGEYYRIKLFGDTLQLPLKVDRKKPGIRRINKNPLLFGFEIIPEGVGEFFGFSVDGDHRFLLGDFTITHNSFIIKCLTTLYPNARFVICTEAASVVSSLYEQLVSVHGKSQVGLIKAGTKSCEETKRIQVSTTKSILRSQIETCDILLFDEVHNVGDNQITDLLMNHVDHARMFGFTASLWRGDHAEMLIKGLFGEVIAEASYQEAVDHNLVVPIKAIMVPCKTREAQVTNSMMLDRKFNYIYNAGRNQLIADLARDIPADEQTLIMVNTFEHAVRLHQLLPEYTVCHGGAGVKVKKNKPWLPDRAPQLLLAISKKDGSVHRFLKLLTALDVEAYAEIVLTDQGPDTTSEDALYDVGEIPVDGYWCGSTPGFAYLKLPDKEGVYCFKILDNVVSFPKIFSDYVRADGSPCGEAQMVDRNISGIDLSQYKMTPKIIAKIRKDFEENKLKKLIATNIFSEGVNFVHLKYLIRADGETSKISNTQIPGRLSRIMPGKTCAYLIDFVDHFSEWAYRRSQARFKDYKEAGWVKGTLPPKEK